MIGHIPLIRMRLAHKRPKAVWIWVGINPEKEGPPWEKFSDLWPHPHVVVEPSDNPKNLDLRFVKGLQVHVDGDDVTSRIYGVHLACMLAGAKQIITYHNGELIIDEGEADAVS